jgi:cation diffusion facilitator CzcD-associated flavoprotein CzcO
MVESNVLIIGAGPAGLAMAGRLRQKGIPFEIVEKSQFPGNAWRNHYDRLHLHTVKEHSHLPHLPFPKDYPQYVSRQQLVDYFDRYVQFFELRPRFGIRIEKIRRVNDQWEAVDTDNNIYKAKHIVLATGVNNEPYRPTFEGEGLFQGNIIHSRAYKNPAPFINQNVLVVGMGNTGAEIALDLSEQGIKTFLSVRNPVNIVPRDFLGNPTQKTAFLLAKLPDGLANWIGKTVPKIAFGDLRPYGLKRSDMAPMQQLKETGKTPVIDIGTVANIKAGKIKVKPGIGSFTEQGVLFGDGTEENIDTVILATGYRPTIDQLLDIDTEDLLNNDGVPTDCIGQGAYQGLYFLGFDNYKPGGILGIINTESERIVEVIAG